MGEILQHLKIHGKSLDPEIAEAGGISLDQTRRYLAELAAQGLWLIVRLDLRMAKESKGCVAG